MQPKKLEEEVDDQLSLNEDELNMDLNLDEHEAYITQDINAQNKLDKKNTVERVAITECLIIRHDDKWRLRWDLLIILLALWNSISIPLEVAFQDLQFTKTSTYAVIGVIIDVLFSLDIAVNMRSTFISEKTGAEITNGRQIARNYIFGGRFLVDLMASIPFDAILPSG